MILCTTAVSYSAEKEVLLKTTSTWDNTEYSAEFTALKNAYEEFSGQVVYGFVDPETGLKELNDALYAAGLQDYMDAKQAALDKWAEENGIK